MSQASKGLTGGIGRRGIVIAVLSATALLAPPAADALAAQRFADPAGSAKAPCTEAEPCDIETAVNAANPSDEVIINPGTYAPAGVIDTAVDNLDIHGVFDRARPLIKTAVANSVRIDVSGDRLRHVEIQHSGGSSALVVMGATAERVFVHTTTGEAACAVIGTLRDSVCWNTATGFNPRGVESASSSTASATLRNVTAVSTDTDGWGVRVGADVTGNVTVDAKNVIAEGPEADVEADDIGGTATAKLDYSNYDTTSAITAGAFVTPAGTASNQTARPLFVDAGTGDFHQAAGSPTINAGTPDSLGTTDIDGDARTQGAAVDIGADEAEGDPPDTSITGGPSGPTNDSTPTFDFSSDEGGSSFECSVDGAPVACSGPGDSHTTDPLSEGAHTFEVAATDGFFNEDASPASRSFSVDTVPPNTLITGGPIGATGDSTPTFSFSSTEGGSSFECSVDSVVVACSGPGASHTTSPLSDGAHTFRVAAADGVLNEDASPASRSFTVDTTAPNTTITARPPNRTTSRMATFRFSASEPGSSFQCKLDGGAFVACNSPKIYRGLSRRRHSVQVRAIDALGHRDPSSASDSWKILRPARR